MKKILQRKTNLRWKNVMNITNIHYDDYLSSLSFSEYKFPHLNVILIDKISH